MITGESHVDLEAVWLEVSRRLTGQLLRRGVSRPDAEDLVQECAVRVMASNVAWRDAEDLMRWCNTVVRNLHVDSLRRRSEPVGELAQFADRADHHDVHRSVNARLLLAELRSVWPRLSVRDRSALVAAAEGVTTGDRKAAVRENVARHRARQRLDALVTGALGLTGFGLAVRRCVRGAARWTVPTAALASAVLGLAVLDVERDARPGMPVVHPAVLIVSAGHAGAVVPSRQPIHSAPAPVRRAAARSATAPAAATTTAVQLPTGDRVVVRGRDRNGAEPLVCVRGLVVVDRACLPSLVAPGTPS